MSGVEAVAEMNSGSKNVESRNRKRRKGRLGKACRHRWDPVRTGSPEPNRRWRRKYPNQLRVFVGNCERERKLT